MLAAMTVLPPQSCWGGSVDTPFSGISCITHAGSGLGPWYIGHVMHKHCNYLHHTMATLIQINNNLTPIMLLTGTRGSKVITEGRVQISLRTQYPGIETFSGEILCSHSFWLGQEAIVPTKYAGSLTDHVGDCQWKDSWNCYQTSSHSFTIYELIPGAQW